MHTPLDFGSSDESDPEPANGTANAEPKRRKEQQRWKPRDVRSRAAFAAEEPSGVSASFIHAAEIPKLDRATKYESALPGLEHPHEVVLQYPSMCEKER